MLFQHFSNSANDEAGLRDVACACRKIFSACSSVLFLDVRQSCKQDMKICVRCESCDILAQYLSRANRKGALPEFRLVEARNADGGVGAARRARLYDRGHVLVLVERSQICGSCESGAYIRTAIAGDVVRHRMAHAAASG